MVWHSKSDLDSLRCSGTAWCTSVSVRLPRISSSQTAVFPYYDPPINNLLGANHFFVLLDCLVAPVQALLLGICPSACASTPNHAIKSPALPLTGLRPSESTLPYSICTVTCLTIQVTAVGRPATSVHAVSSGCLFLAVQLPQ
jgi:hypothetical protein